MQLKNTNTGKNSYYTPYAFRYGVANLLHAGKMTSMAADVCLPTKLTSGLFLAILFVLVVGSDDPPGLYKPVHNVVILSSENFKSLIYGKDNTWCVEFYNSWCGHCIRFAPTWIKLVKDTKGINWDLHVQSLDIDS